MKCPHCGGNNPIHQTYCSACGKKIEVSFDSIAESVRADTSVDRTAVAAHALLAATVLTALAGGGVWLVTSRFGGVDIPVEKALVPAAPPPPIPMSSAEAPALEPVPGSPEELLLALPDASDLSAKRLGHRRDPVRKALHAMWGGDPNTLASVRRGLVALVSHQDRRSGAWHVSGRWEGGRLKWGDTGVTALAVLALLGDGHVWTNPKDSLGQAAGRGVRFLVASQDESGRIGPASGNYMYNHGMATAALAEAYAMSGLEPLRERVERAIEFLASAQRPSGGWDYKRAKGTRVDISVSAWQIAALRSAALAGVDDPGEARAKAAKFVDALTSRTTAETGYEKRPDPSESIPHPTLGPTAMALAARVALGEKPSSAIVRRQAAILLKNLPQWKTEWRSQPPKNAIHLYYYWYHGTVGMRGVGGGQWKTWYEAATQTLLAGQEKDGAWPPIGRWAADGGRVFTTAMAVLTLESTYRYP
ncbi:MAG: prenyltransferase/squalene oxidase repeat-containing protein [Planctomycetota bacterium]|jgi:hypothetical protein